MQRVENYDKAIEALEKPINSNQMTFGILRIRKKLLGVKRI
jgi:hypothetical protein